MSEQDPKVDSGRNGEMICYPIPTVTPVKLEEIERPFVKAVTFLGCDARSEYGNTKFINSRTQLWSSSAHQIHLDFIETESVPPIMADGYSRMCRWNTAADKLFLQEHKRRGGILPGWCRERIDSSSWLLSVYALPKLFFPGQVLSDRLPPQLPLSRTLLKGPDYSENLSVEQTRELEKNHEVQVWKEQILICEQAIQKYLLSEDPAVSKAFVRDASMRIELARLSLQGRDWASLTKEEHAERDGLVQFIARRTRFYEKIEFPFICTLVDAAKENLKLLFFSFSEKRIYEARLICYDKFRDIMLCEVDGARKKFPGFQCIEASFGGRKFRRVHQIAEFSGWREIFPQVSAVEIPVDPKFLAEPVVSRPAKSTPAETKTKFVLAPRRRVLEVFLEYMTELAYDRKPDIERFFNMLNYEEQQKAIGVAEVRIRNMILVMISCGTSIDLVAEEVKRHTLFAPTAVVDSFLFRLIGNLASRKPMLCNRGYHTLLRNQGFSADLPIKANISRSQWTDRALYLRANEFWDESPQVSPKPASISRALIAPRNLDQEIFVTEDTDFEFPKEKRFVLRIETTTVALPLLHQTSTRYSVLFSRNDVCGGGMFRELMNLRVPKKVASAFNGWIRLAWRVGGNPNRWPIPLVGQDVFFVKMPPGPGGSQLMELGDTIFGSCWSFMLEVLPCISLVQSAIPVPSDLVDLVYSFLSANRPRRPPRPKQAV